MKVTSGLSNYFSIPKQPKQLTPNILKQQKFIPYLGGSHLQFEGHVGMIFLYGVIRRFLIFNICGFTTFMLTLLHHLAEKQAEIMQGTTGLILGTRSESKYCFHLHSFDQISEAWSQGSSVGKGNKWARTIVSVALTKRTHLTIFLWYLHRHLTVEYGFELQDLLISGFFPIPPALGIQEVHNHRLNQPSMENNISAFPHGSFLTMVPSSRFPTADGKSRFSSMVG